MMGLQRAVTLALAAVVLALVGILACAGTDSGTGSMNESGPAGGADSGAVRLDVRRAAPAATAAPPPTAVAAARPAVLPTPSPRAPRPTEAPSAPAARPAQPESASKVQASVAAQNRIIVHTGDMTLVVGSVADSVDSVIALAREYGGWVVNSDRSSRHSGFVAIRVPAQTLTEVMDLLEAMAMEVKTRSLSSEDVTDEYVDTQSRLVSLRETERVLLDLVARADNVEHALQVHQEITQIQMQIEQMQGRINFLDQTAAYSLLNVRLELATIEMAVDAGPDASYRVGQTIRFKATFRPPEGTEKFGFVWDFGDGRSVSNSGSAPLADDPGARVTSSVTYAYPEEGDYIARVTINGAGDAGLTEGEDAVILTVSEVPNPEVFAGEGRTVDEGEAVEYRGSFTRPEGLWDFEYRWNFGDGTPTVVGTPGEGDTRAAAVHSYADHRPQPYPVLFTVSAMSEAGRVSDSATFGVRVVESVGFAVGGWDVGDTGKSAVRALSAVGRFLVTAIIWIGIFSPVWLIALGLIVLGRRRSRHSEDGNSSGTGFRLPGWRPSASGEQALSGPPADPTVRE